MKASTTQRAEDLTDQAYWSKRWKRKDPTRCTSRKKPPKVLKGILENIPHEGSRPTVCEIGCAPGSMLIKMAQLQPDYEYYGLDYSESGLVTTRDALNNVGASAELLSEDYFTYLPSEPFDLVVSFGVIEHASDPIEAIRRHADFTRDGGLVAITIPNYSSPVVKWMAQKVDPRVFDSHNVTIMNTKALTDAMICAGLSGVSVMKTAKPKMRTSCPDKTFSRTCWRTIAKLWNLFARVLPSGVLWSTELWAVGRKISIQQPPLNEDGRICFEKLR